MSSTDRTGRSTGAYKHVRHYEWMLRSPAYRSLSCYARCLLTEISRRYDGENNGAISMSVREAAELLGANKDTAAKAFRQLVALGFIRPHEKGAFHVKVRHATTWILTEYPYAGQKPTKEFMSLKPARENLEHGPTTPDQRSHETRPCATTWDRRLAARSHETRPLWPKSLPVGPTTSDTI